MKFLIPCEILQTTFYLVSYKHLCIFHLANKLLLNVYFSALSKKEMQKHFSLAARTRIWETMLDGRPIAHWMNPAGYFIPHLSIRRGYGQ